MTNISQSGPPPVAALLEMNVELVLGLRFTGPVMPGPRMQHVEVKPQNPGRSTGTRLPPGLCFLEQNPCYQDVLNNSWRIPQLIHDAATRVLRRPDRGAGSSAGGG